MYTSRYIVIVLSLVAMFVDGQRHRRHVSDIVASIVCIHAAVSTDQVQVDHRRTKFQPPHRWHVAYEGVCNLPTTHGAARGVLNSTVATGVRQPMVANSDQRRGRSCVGILRISTNGSMVASDTIAIHRVKSSDIVAVTIESTHVKLHDCISMIQCSGIALQLAMLSHIPRGVHW